VLCVTTPPSALRDIFGAVDGESGDNILSWSKDKDWIYFLRSEISVGDLVQNLY
jgi:hypothetical protein